MFQKITTWLVIGILGLVPFLGAAGTTVAQSDSGFPDEIVVDELAVGEIPASATAPGTLAFERIAMPASTGLPVREVSAAEILYVERGTLTVADGLGLSSPLAAETSVHLRSGASYTAINDTTDDISFLRLSLTTSSVAATPVAVPVPQSEASDGVEVTTLAEFELTAMPASPSILFLSRATWGTGIDSGEYTQNGPIGVLTESGTLTISSPSGIDGQLGEGQAVLLPPDTVLRTRNDGTSDAVALLFGVIPTDGPAVTTSGSSTIDVSRLEEVSEAVTTPSGLLYQADSTTGFEDWSKTGGWQTVSNMYVNDGRGEGLFIAAPFDIPVNDYAVEVEMQWVRGEFQSGFGIVSRWSGERGYFAGYQDISNCGWDWREICLYGEDDGIPIATTELQVDSEWHTYRLEVQGNSVRLFVDGAIVIETTDNSFLSAGRAGLWSNESQVNVRRFSIIALGEN